MLKVLQSKPIISIVLITILMLAFSIDTIPVSIMEARNFVTAREMIVDGNWLMTTMNGEARYEKPPLPTWLTAFFGLIFGLKSLIALRFPAILFVALIGVFTFLLSKKILGDSKHSYINALIVITSFYVIGITLEAPWDIFTHGFMLVGIYHLFQLFEKHQQYWKHALIAGVFIGCSFLCKGPISMYALMLPFLLAYGFTYRFKGYKTKILPTIVCLLVILLVGGWWFVYVRLNDPHTFEAIATRETNNWSSYNIKPFYYYWSFFTQSGIWTIPAFISLLYPYLKNRVSNLKAYKFSLLWTVIAVVLLSLVPEKKSRYLMPVLIPLAINIGFYIEYLFRRFKDLKDKRETFPVYFNFGLIALIAIGFPIAIYFILGEQLEGRWFLFILSSILMLTIGVLIILQLKKRNFQGLFLLTIGFFVITFIFGLPLLKPIIGIQNNPISNLEKDELKIYGFSNVSPEMVWHYGTTIPEIKFKDGAYEFPDEQKFGILAYDISEKDWKLLVSNYTVEKAETFDLNTVPKDSRRHNSRLINDFYILTKR